MADPAPMTPSPMIPPDAAPAFLAANGWTGADILPLAGDASFRRYFRVHDGERQAVLMDAPPPQEDVRPFAAMTDYLTGHGFHAPAILGRDVQRGLLLLEDMGDLRMRDHLDRAVGEERSIYEKAVDELIRLADCPVADVAAYDEATYQREAGLLPEYYAPAAGLSVDEAAYRALWSELLAPVIAAQGQRPVTVLRDYHAENIMLLADGTLGHLDFQDALVGHPAYDLVSLLQDARRDVSVEVESEMLERYRQGTGVNGDFLDHYAILGAQRNAKIIGIFTRLWKRDGKPRYLDYLPRMWGLLERDLAHPSLAPMQDWFDANIPADIRAKPLT